MSWWSKRLLGSLAAAACLLACAAARGETATLELKRLSPQGPIFNRSDYLFRTAQPQRFFVQLGLKGPQRPDGAAEFAKIVKKEPKYECKDPIRWVVTLGSQKYALALDCTGAKEEKAEKAKEAEKPKDGEKRPARAKAPAIPPGGYNRLYLDANGNGDLTDDKPVDAEKSPGIYPRGYSNNQFPRVDVTLYLEGTKLDYGFFLRAYSNSSGDFRYASVSLTPGVYREGKIKLDGKERQIVLLDFNSNGRFGDETKVINAGGPEGRVYPQQGDMILVDPRPETGSPYDVTTGSYRNHVSKLVCIDGRFYDLKVSPAGDQVTLTPSSAPLGAVASPQADFRAVLYSDQGLVKIMGGDKPVPVPAGDWKLLNYTLDLTAAREKAEAKKAAEKKEAEKKPAEGAEKKQSSALLKALSNALLGSSPVSSTSRVSRTTVVSASGTAKGEPIKVATGKTTELKFGPPFQPIVKVGYRDQQNAHLSLSLVGSAGEECTNMMVDGGRPEKPEFTITTAKGDVVERGAFDYG